MRKLLESRRYKDAVDLFFQRESEIASNVTCNLALTACTKLRDDQRGIRIDQQLSSQARADPLIQASLLHFYSE